MARFVSLNNQKTKVVDGKPVIEEIPNREGQLRWAQLAHIIAIEETNGQRLTVFLTNQRQVDINCSAEEFFKRVPRFHEEF